MKIEVLRSDGKRGFVPLENLDKAILSGEYKFANPEQEIEVINSQGKTGYIKGEKLLYALESKKYQLNKNQIAQELPKEDDWSTYLAKKSANVISEFPDLPVNLANLGETGIKFLANKLAEEQKDNPINIQKPERLNQIQALEEWSKTPNYFREENVDRPSKWIKKGFGNIGFDIEPKTTDSLKKIAGHGVEWALPGGILTKFNKAAKGAMIGGTLGLGSGIAQEEFGADPLASNLTAAGLQMVTPNPASLLNKFSKQGKIATQEAAVSKLLKDITKEQGLERLKNFNPQSGSVIPTTAEVALNRDISNLHNAYAPNLTGVDAKRAYNDAILRDKLNAIGNNLNPSAVEVGEAGRSKIQNTLKSAEAKRTAASAGLYENLEKSQNTYPVSNFENYTNNSIIAELGDIEKGLVKHKNILPTKYKKLAEKPKAELSKLEKELEKEVIGLEKKYSNLNDQNKEQILNPLVLSYNEKAIKIKALKTEIAALESGQYKPSHIDRAISEIGNNIIELKRSQKGGNKSLLRHFKKQKEEMRKDLNATPEGSAHRTVYSQHSKPVNDINRDKLLNKFVSKNEFDQHRVPVDDLARNIMQAPNKNIRNYMEHIKGHEAEDLTKAYVRDMYLGKAPDGAIPSYNTSNNFLRPKKEKLNAIYSPEELNTFDEVNSYLKNRAEVSKGNSAYGSATVPKSELQAKVQKYLGSSTQQPLALLENIPGLPFKQWASKQFIRPNPNYGVLEEALIDPIFANSLLGRQPLARKKGNYLPSLFSVINNANMDTQY